MLLEELSVRQLFVGGETVEDDVNLLPGRTQRYDLLQKATKSRLLLRAAVLPWTRPVAVLKAA